MNKISGRSALGTVLVPSFKEDRVNMDIYSMNIAHPCIINFTEVYPNLVSLDFCLRSLSLTFLLSSSIHLRLSFE